MRTRFVARESSERVAGPMTRAACAMWVDQHSETSDDSRRLVTYFVDTNAGPVFNVRASSASRVKRYMTTMIPLLQRRGYSSSWRRSKGWHVIDCKNSKGRVVHSAAFKSVSASDGRVYQPNARVI